MMTVLFPNARFALAALLMLSAQSAGAADGPAAAPPPPEPRSQPNPDPNPDLNPGPAQEMFDGEPEVTIVPRGRDVIEEYRIQGRLYMIRVVPSHGVPYFLIDTDGDGNLETRRNELSEDLLIPNWTLFRW